MKSKTLDLTQRRNGRQKMPASPALHIIQVPALSTLRLGGACSLGVSPILTSLEASYGFIGFVEWVAML